VATLKCGGPPTMPEENRGPWTKKFENRCCTWPIDTLLHCISYQRIERTVKSTEISYSTVGLSYIIDTQRRPSLVQRNAEQLSPPYTLFSHRLIG